MSKPRPAVAKLRARMTRSKHGWRSRDLDRLYRGYGFVDRQRGRHTVYFHPRFPELLAAVTRSSGALPPGYVDTALDLPDLLDVFAGSKHGDEDDRPAP